MVNLTIGGGNFRGLAFLGALEHLHSNNLLTNIDEFYGCSIGSIIGILYLIGYTPKELLDIMIDVNFSNFWDFNLNNLDINYSLLGYSFINFIINVFQKKEDINITFIEFYNKYSININILCVSMSKHEIVKFNHINFPNVKVLTAMQASSTIPILFPAIKIENDYYIDGCSKCLSGCQYENNNGYIIKLEQNVNIINNFHDYVSELFKTLLINGTDINTINTVNIKLPKNLMNKINFSDINKSDKIQLYYEGMKQAKDAIRL